MDVPCNTPKGLQANVFWINLIVVFEDIKSKSHENYSRYKNSLQNSTPLRRIHIGRLFNALSFRGVIIR